MGTENDETERSPAESQQRAYPFGLSANQFTILVVLIGLIGPGLLVFVFEQANLPAAADLVWIIGYGTTIFVAWFMWLRPIDLAGPTSRDASGTEVWDKPEPAAEEVDNEEAEEVDSETEPSDNAAASAASTGATEDKSEVESQDTPETADSSRDP